MSYLISNLVACETIQEQLIGGAEGQFTTFDPTKKLDRSNFLDYLLTNENTDNITQTISPGEGKTRTLRIVYSPRFLESEVKTDLSTFDCVATRDIGELSTTFDIDTDEGAMIDRKIPLSKLQDVCKNDEFYIARTLSQMMAAGYRKIATTSAAESALLTGKWSASTNAPGDLLTVTGRNATKTYLSDAKADIDLAYKHLEVGDMRPIIFGADKWWKYAVALGFGCCSNIEAIDIGEFGAQDPIIFTFDRRVESKLGADEALGVIPGALQLLTYNEFTDVDGSPRSINDDGEKQGTLFDPATGLTWDFYAKYDCRVWNFIIKLAHKVVGMPSDLFCSGDRLEGVTYANNLKMVFS